MEEKQKDEKQKRAMIRRYFLRPRPQYPVGVAGVGILLITAGIVEIGITAMLCGVATLAAVLRGTNASDEQIDAWLHEDLEVIRKGAQDRMGFHEDQLTRWPPDVLCGPIWERPQGIPTEEFLFRAGRDGKYRFSINKVLAIFFTKDDVNYYTCDFNFFRNIALNEGYKRYFYEDVVAVGLSETGQSYTLPAGTKLITAQKFSLSFTNGEVVSLAVPIYEFRDTERADKPRSTIEEMVRAAQAMLIEGGASRNRYHSGIDGGLPV